MLKKWINNLNHLNINSEEKGQQALGELESKVMQVLWQVNDYTTIKNVHQEVFKEKQLAYTTIQTTIDRLFHKGLLKRIPKGRSFIYASRINKNEFETHVSNKVIDAIAGKLNNISLAHFVEVLDSENKEKLEYLAELINKKLNKES